MTENGPAQVNGNTGVNVRAVRSSGNTLQSRATMDDRIFSREDSERLVKPKDKRVERLIKRRAQFSARTSSTFSEGSLDGETGAYCIISTARDPSWFSRLWFPRIK